MLSWFPVDRATTPMDLDLELVEKRGVKSNRNRGSAQKAIPSVTSATTSATAAITSAAAVKTTEIQTRTRCSFVFFCFNVLLLQL